jgi:cephalosporin hydroxylase
MIIVDQDRIIVDEGGAPRREFSLGSPEGFRVLSDLWLRSGWETKHVYSFTWLGRPIIQLPEDLIRVQEVIYRTQPDVIVETGIAHGGSLVFYASLCKAMGRGRVIGVDIDVRPANRAALARHELSGCYSIVEGSSTDPTTVRAVRSQVRPDEKVFVVLDSNHTKQHVLEELRAYSELVSVGSYIVAADGIMGVLAGASRTGPDWTWNNPKAAAEEFVRTHLDFAMEEPGFLFNEGTVTERITYWPSGFLRRIR